MAGTRQEHGAWKSPHRPPERPTAPVVQMGDVVRQPRVESSEPGDGTPGQGAAPTMAQDPLHLLCVEARRPRPLDLVLGRSAGLGSTLFTAAHTHGVPVVNLFDYFCHPTPTT